MTNIAKTYGWLALPVVASLAFTFGFACIAPFAAFGAAAALSLSRKDAYALTGAVWLANQLAGYGFLSYPVTAESFLWGLALAAAAFAATAAALWAAPRTHAVLVFVAAFAAYEGLLLGISLLVGAAQDYTLTIQGRIFALNAIAFAAMLLLRQLRQPAVLAVPNR